MEIGLVLEPIETSVQLSSALASASKSDGPLATSASSSDSDLQHCSKHLIRCLSGTLQEHSELVNGPSVSYRSTASISEGTGCCRQQGSQHPSQHHQKRMPRVIGKRGTRDTEFMHPSSLAYSKRDQLVCT